MPSPDPAAPSAQCRHVTANRQEGQRGPQTSSHRPQCSFHLQSQPALSRQGAHPEGLTQTLALMPDCLGQAAHATTQSRHHHSSFPTRTLGHRATSSASRGWQVHLAVPTWCPVGTPHTHGRCCPSMPSPSSHPALHPARPPRAEQGCQRTGWEVSGPRLHLPSPRQAHVAASGLPGCGKGCCPEVYKDTRDTTAAPKQGLRTAGACSPELLNSTSAPRVSVAWTSE